MNLYPPQSPATDRPAGLQALPAFAIAAALFLALHAYHDVRVFWFDADLYWQLADLPRFTSVKNNIRGYFLAVLLAPARYLSEAAQSYWPLRLYLSVAYAWGLTWLVPLAYTSLFGGRMTTLRRLVPAFLAALIFPGMLVYPLSDLPALLLMLGALLSLRAASARDGSNGLPLRWIALAAALAAAAYNVRTIYLFLLAGILAAIVVMGWRDTRRRALQFAVAVAAALAVMLPQGLLNQQMHGRFSFNPVVMGGGQSLFVVQLVMGMRTQRYETMVLPPPSGGAVMYKDPAGARLLAGAGGFGAITSPQDYVTRVVLARPLDFAGLMGRHFVNGLDVRDGMLYLRRFSQDRHGIAVLNFLVLAAAAWVAALQMTRYRLAGATPAMEPAPRWRWWLALWLAPVAFILPGMVETRFFAALHLLAWCTLAFHFDRRVLAASLKEHPVLVTAALVGAASLFFAVTLSTMAQGPA